VRFHSGWPIDGDAIVRDFLDRFDVGEEVLAIDFDDGAIFIRSRSSFNLKAIKVSLGSEQMLNWIRLWVDDPAYGSKSSQELLTLAWEDLSESMFEAADQIGPNKTRLLLKSDGGFDSE
jgi:hypothetical protein